MWRNWNLCALLAGMENGAMAAASSGRGGRRLRALKMELPYDLAISLLSVYPQELRAGPQRDINTARIIAAILTITKRWKTPRCLLMDG